MIVHRDLESPSSLPTVVTVGAYDGVHLGHRAVIAEVRSLAARHRCSSAVATFDRHPATVVRPDSAPRLLCDEAQKLELLESTGVEATWLIPFDAERAAEPAEDFVREVLVETLRAKVVVVGEDFHFGKGRGGTVELLRTLGAQWGFEVVGMALVDIGPGGRKVSSTQIRQCLEAGDVRRAEELLGRYHEVRGPVVHGDARGRTIGFPTANVAVSPAMCLPADGIYAGWYLRADGIALPAAINLGRRPTFHSDQRYSLLEAHVLDFAGDLYDEPARVQFVSRLRAEMKFDSIDALVDQLTADVVHARRQLGLAP